MTFEPTNNPNQTPTSTNNPVPTPTDPSMPPVSATVKPDMNDTTASNPASVDPAVNPAVNPVDPSAPAVTGPSDVSSNNINDPAAPAINPMSTSSPADAANTMPAAPVANENGDQDLNSATELQQGVDTPVAPVTPDASPIAEVNPTPSTVDPNLGTVAPSESAPIDPNPVGPTAPVSDIGSNAVVPPSTGTPNVPKL